MVTIQNLDVRMDLEGGDEAAFARLFGRYIAHWSAEEARRKHQSRRAAEDRSLGDRPAEGVNH